MLAVTTLLFGQDFVVEYLDGYLDLDEGGSWYELYIGDTVSADDTVRLDDGYAELSDGTLTIRLTRPGTYYVGNLVSSARRTNNSGVGGLVINRIGRLTGQQEEPQQTAAGGARASEAVNQNQPTWAGGESVDELINQGVALLQEGEYQDAYWRFLEANEYAFDDTEIARSLFYYGYSAALIGKTPEAFKLLYEVGPDPETDYYEDHVIVLGQLLIETFAFEDAIDQLEPLVESGAAEAGARQSAMLLTGLAYEGLGDVRMARTFLRRSRDLVPDSPGAEIAQELLDEL
jgi:tetratricopeptide (TPR) repeat protein